jgi:uncharacterized protein YbdZ (MbtH family)
MQRYTLYFTWKLLYMFSVVPPPIIRSANNCIYSIWYVTLLLLPAAIAAGTSVVGRGRAGPACPDHDQQHWYHHAPPVKPEAATAVVELLMKGVWTPETC